MDIKDKETIQRALGIIEGVTCGLTGAAASLLLDALEMIDDVLSREENDDGRR